MKKRVMKKRAALNPQARNQAAPAAEPRAGTRPKFWNFTDNGETAELQLFGTIESEESWWSDDCVTYRNFINELNALGEKKAINVVIQSGGGDVFAANAIYNALLGNKAVINGTIIGICASAATIILMACDNRRIAKNAILMAHNPSVSLWGSYQADDLLKLYEVTNQVKKSIVTAYMERLDKTEEEINALMDSESWYVGQEAVDAGFCDEVVETGASDSFSDAFKGARGFTNYTESLGFIPDDIRKKVQALTKTPQPGRGTFSDTRSIAPKNLQKGKKSMDEMLEQAAPAITDAATLKSTYPDLCAEVAAEAVDAERERLKAIDEIAAGIPADLVEKAKYTEPVSAADLALAQMKANNRAGKRFMDDLEEDMGESGAAEVGGTPNGGIDDTAEKQEEKKAKVGGFADKLKNDKRRGK